MPAGRSRAVMRAISGSNATLVPPRTLMSWKTLRFEMITDRRTQFEAAVLAYGGCLLQWLGSTASDLTPSAARLRRGIGR